MERSRTWIGKQSRPVRFIVMAVVFAAVYLSLELLLFGGSVVRAWPGLIGAVVTSGGLLAWRPARTD